METLSVVQSSDGVEIARWLSGGGPNLVLVHGVSADHTRWASVLPRLAEHFTVCTVDRRGRGESGDAPGYSLEREYDDIAAVCESLDGPVNLLGHSHGGMFALGAALRARNIEKLILYEPSIDLGEPLVDRDVARRMEARLQEGDREGMLQILFREVVDMSEDEIEMLRADPSWPGRVASAHTILRELDIELPNASQFQSLTTPTLLLTGSDSPRAEIAATDAVHAALPNSRKLVMPGQGHAAMTTAPDLFVDEVIAFLLH